MLKNNKQQGFTIVELLIVIVVIAILAAISIVAYGGIQNRGKASSGQSLAGQIAKKVEAYNTIQSTYPNYSELRNNYDTGTATASTKTLEAKLDDQSSITNTAIDATVANGGKVVQYGKCSGTGATNGARVQWWDYSKSSAQATIVNIGDTSTCPSLI